jgi:hypothetical protein
MLAVNMKLMMDSEDKAVQTDDSDGEQLQW